MSAVPALLRGLCDDAALFPPGNAPLSVALAAHTRYRAGDIAELVGPLIFPIPRIDELAACAAGPLDIVLTAPDGPSSVPPALARIDAIAGVTVVGVEIACTAADSVQGFFAKLRAVSPDIAELDTYLEVPRDDRRATFLDRIADGPYAAKFRTGGVVSDAYPDERELAHAVKSAVAAGIPFKATAGLHHAVRNTDPETGFEQHGFLNLLLATERAGHDADVTALAAVLADRDGAAIATQLATLTDADAAVLRGAFRSFGTCSINDPLAELVALRLLPPTLRPDSTAEGSLA